MPQITRDLRAFEDSLWLRLYHDVLPQTLAVIRVYDEAGNVIKTHEQIGGLKGDFVTRLGKRHALA
jgi:hypothetical protein